MKKFFLVIIIIVVFGLLTVACLPGYIDKTQSKDAAKGVLENVIGQKYEEAFENVYFYDKASDQEPIISYDEPKRNGFNELLI